MKKYIFLFLTLFAVTFSANAADETIGLDHAAINRGDMASVNRGAKFFASVCMACHTLIYLRYDKVAQAAGVTYDKMPVNATSWPTAVKPPDLSLEADVRGVDWIYTYLHSFYQDPSQPTGTNNLLVPNTAMPNMVQGYQGVQVLATDVKYSKRFFGKQIQWYDLLVLQSNGSMSPDEFDATMRDVVNFLAYASAPYHDQQEYLGYWVIAFLFVFWVLAYLLKKEYWKNVKK